MAQGEAVLADASARGDQGFGEGHLKAPFESIEIDRMRRGVLDTA